MFVTIGGPFEMNGEKFTPKAWMSTAQLAGFVYVRHETAGCTQKFVAVAPTYDEAMMIGQAFAKSQRPSMVGIELTGGVKKPDGMWWLTWTVEGLD